MAEKDIYSYLEEIKKRPGMFLRQGRALEDLETLLWGYEGALHQHNLEEPGCGFNRAFMEYLEHRFGWDCCLGWAHAISEQTQSEDEGLKLFFSLVDDIRIR